MKVFLATALVSLLAGCLLLPFFTHPSILNAMPGQSMAPSANFNCSSNDMKRKYCPADTRGGVQLVYQRSGSPCTFGQTWGWDNRGSGWTAVAAPILPSVTPAVRVVRLGEDGDRNITCTAPLTMAAAIVAPSTLRAAFAWFVNATAPLACTGQPGVGIAVASGSIAAVAPISKLVRRAGNLLQTGPFIAPPTT